MTAVVAQQWWWWWSHRLCRCCRHDQRCGGGWIYHAYRPSRQSVGPWVMFEETQWHRVDSTQ